MGRLQRDNQWYKDLETEVVEKIIAEEFEEIANRTKEEVANSVASLPYKDLETEVVEKIIAEEFEEIANRTKEEIANSWHHKHKARIHNARISRLFMFLFIYSFSKMPESKTFYFSFEVAIIGTIYGLWEVAAYYTSDEPGRTFYHFDFVLFLLGVHVLAI